MDAIEEIKRDFLIEAKELLSGTEKCFLELEKDPKNPDNLNQLFRLAHNLKGTSKAVGFDDLADFTHRLESLLLNVKEGKVEASGPIVELLLRCNDYLLRTIEALEADINASYVNQALSEEVVAASEGRSEYTTTNTQVTDPPIQNFAINSTVLTQSQKPKDENIRVSLNRIEKLLNNVGELSILQAVMVQQSLERGTSIPLLMRETLSAMSKIIKETQSISMGLRMLPIKQTFQKMERIIRDTSKSLTKEVELHLSGEETEIDKTVLEQIGDPLVHIVRNAIDHGLEDEQGRAAAGKPKVGHVHLSAYHRAGHVVIEIRDDGKGLSAESLVKKAKEKGIISQDASLSSDQAHQLIFAPGFSTKDQVSDISGRGVGMDVVRTNIAALQGTVEIETEMGKGTCFRILLPLTLAIIDSVVVRVEQQRYVIPLAQVSEFVKPQEQEVNQPFERLEFMKLREETVPIIRLSTLFDHRSVSRQPWELTALIVRDGGIRSFAVLVDQVISQQQVVIKPLGSELKGKSGLMGSAILGDGKPALILDLIELIKICDANQINKTKATKALESA